MLPVYVPGDRFVEGVTVTVSVAGVVPLPGLTDSQFTPELVAVAKKLVVDRLEIVKFW